VTFTSEASFSFPSHSRSRRDGAVPAPLRLGSGAQRREKPGGRAPLREPTGGRGSDFPKQAERRYGSFTSARWIGISPKERGVFSLTRSEAVGGIGSNIRTIR